ncbi:MAG: hypothetical protein QNJ92_15930, partial [Alphaproteobacteria bacterium]|nr:hypothetical protein [Alphaproteobacteria bacterium]
MLARTAAYCAVALALAAVIWSSPLSAPVHAADLDDVLDRVDRLQRELNALQRQVYRGEVPAGTAAAGTPGAAAGDLQAGPIAARINIRLNAIEQELQTLTGMIEEIRFRTDQANQRLDKLVGDVDFRLSQIERTVGISTTAPPATDTAQAPADEMGRPLQSAPAASEPATAAGAATAGAATAGATTEAPPPSESTGTLFEGQFQQAQQRAKSGQQSAAAAPPQQSPASTAPATPVAQTILPDAPPEDRYTFAFNLLRKQ